MPSYPGRVGVLQFLPHSSYGDRRIEEFPTRSAAQNFMRQFNRAGAENFSVPTDVLHKEQVRAVAEAVAQSEVFAQLQEQVNRLAQAVADLAALAEKPRGRKPE